MKLDPKKVKVHPARKMKDVLDTRTVKKSEEAEKNSRDCGTASRLSGHMTHLWTCPAMALSTRFLFTGTGSEIIRVPKTICAGLAGFLGCWAMITSLKMIVTMMLLLMRSNETLTLSK